jgi:hypothetical protein
MNNIFRAALRAALRSRAFGKSARGGHAFPNSCRHNSGIRRLLTSALVVTGLLTGAGAAHAGLQKPAYTPLQSFGFATGGRANTRAEYEQHLNVSKAIFGDGGLLRTGLGWDPTNQNVPGFVQWSYEVLEPALARNQIVVPSVRTLRLGSGELRIPTDAQWAYGLREVVRMYGPNGVYQKGGSYLFNGRLVNVAPHPTFAGLTDFEIWNEPESKGDASGMMTPAKMAGLMKIAGEVMRDQAAKQGFAINIMGPGISGFDIAYLKLMKAADPNVFSYFDTLTIHAYTRMGANLCRTGALRCVKTLDIVRSYLNTNGGAHLHLGVTEAGVAGDRASCLGPQVRSEELQRDYSMENFNWIRARPHLNMDFWITTFPIDRPATYSYSCTSTIVDPYYWESKLGVVRPDGSLKPWAIQWKQAVEEWKTP